MNSKPVIVRKIHQKNRHTFAIEWTDGTCQDFRLHLLQKQCPCANCVDERTGERILDEKNLDPHVQAKRILSVGRYALKIEFTTGCSTGIYSFDMLRHLGLVS